jgi:thiamine-monophosphate kinase
MNKKKEGTPISHYGEFGLIDYLTKNIKLKNESTIKGVGDDAAVIDFKDKQTVVTTDLLLEGIHFNLMYAPLKHLGYKAVVVNLSDVYAMNAIPKQITVSIGISSKFSVEAIDEIYQGIYLACEKYNVDLVGGDTSSSLTGLTISITAIGEVGKEDVVYRNTAKENDLICVTGGLGAAFMGLQVLEREKEVFAKNPELQPDLDEYTVILESQLKPEARKDIIEWFKKEKIKPTSMIDISDGLSSELLHICTKSNVGCKVFEEHIPIEEVAAKMAGEINIEPLIAALNGGEDYELLFTCSLEDHDKLKENDTISIIGHVCSKDEGMNIIGRAGNTIPVNAQGWDSLLETD